MLAHLPWWVVVTAVAGCAPERTEEPAPLEFPWKDALARYANCEVTVLVYPEGSTRVGYEYRRRYNALGLTVHAEFYDHAYKDGDLVGSGDTEYDDLGRWTATNALDVATGEVGYHEEAVWDGLDIVSSAAADAQYVYEVDDLHRVLSWTGDDAPFDGRSDGEAIWEYHSGNVLGLGSWDASYDGSWMADYSAVIIDGEIVYEGTRTFDAEGRMVATSRDAYGSNALHSDHTFTYDEHGREARDDGVCELPCWAWDWTTTLFEWSCPGG